MCILSGGQAEQHEADLRPRKVLRRYACRPAHVPSMATSSSLRSMMQTIMSRMARGLHSVAGPIMTLRMV
jgi:hypothetical protein